MPPSAPDDYRIAKRQFIKAQTNATRTRFSLMADAEIARRRPEWEAAFDIQFREQMPQVLDLQSELRALTSGAPSE